MIFLLFYFPESFFLEVSCICSVPQCYFSEVGGLSGGGTCITHMLNLLSLFTLSITYLNPLWKTPFLLRFFFFFSFLHYFSVLVTLLGFVIGFEEIGNNAIVTKFPDSYCFLKLLC